MAEVVTLNGSKLEGDPHAGVVERLERLLAQAKAGEIQAFAYATLEGPSAGLSTGWEGVSGTRWPMAAGILLLHHRYAQMLIEAG